MSDWKKTEIQALNDYIGSPLFKEADENGIYIYEDKDEGLKIRVKPTGDYNFEVTFNDHETTESALELVGDSIIATMQFSYSNNDPELDRMLAEIFEAKEKSDLSENAKKIVDEIIALENKNVDGKK